MCNFGITGERNNVRQGAGNNVRRGAEITLAFGENNVKITLLRRSRCYCAAGAVIAAKRPLLLPSGTVIAAKRPLLRRMRRYCREAAVISNQNLKNAFTLL